MKMFHLKTVLEVAAAKKDFAKAEAAEKTAHIEAKLRSSGELSELEVRIIQNPCCIPSSAERYRLVGGDWNMTFIFPYIVFPYIGNNHPN